MDKVEPGDKALSVIGLLRVELGYVKRLTPAIANEIHLAIADIATLSAALSNSKAMEKSHEPS